MFFIIYIIYVIETLSAIYFSLKITISTVLYISPVKPIGNIFVLKKFLEMEGYTHACLKIKWYVLLDQN